MGSCRCMLMKTDSTETIKAFWESTGIQPRIFRVSPESFTGYGVICFLTERRMSTYQSSTLWAGIPVLVSTAHLSAQCWQLTSSMRIVDFRSVITKRQYSAHWDTVWACHYKPNKMSTKLSWSVFYSTHAILILHWDRNPWWFLY